MELCDWRNRNSPLCEN